MEENTKAGVHELVILSKFEGDPHPLNEVERLSIENGVVVSHDLINQGEVAGPVPNSDMLGKDIGRVVPLEGR